MYLPVPGFKRTFFLFLGKCVTHKAAGSVTAASQIIHQGGVTINRKTGSEAVNPAPLM